MHKSTNNKKFTFCNARNAGTRGGCEGHEDARDAGMRFSSFFEKSLAKNFLRIIFIDA